MGELAAGSYRITLIGSDYTYVDTLAIPASAPDSLFQFTVKVLNKATGSVVPEFPLSLEIWSYDTILVDTTDASGLAHFTYLEPSADSINYYLHGATWAYRGIPEVITLGIDEDWIE